MSERNFYKKISRRELLKIAAVVTCYWGIQGATGCRTRADMPDPSNHPGFQGEVRPVVSKWFTPIGQNRLRCDLCPKQCELQPGERSPCLVRENREGVGVTLAYGNPALMQEDPIERKPFYHVLPSSQVLSISTAGCNLSCKFCELWDIALVKPEYVHAFQMTPEEIIALAQSSGVPAVSFAFGEPVAFFEYMSDIASLAKDAGLMNLIHTAGYIQPEPLAALCPKLDAANVDLKSFDPAFYREVVGGELEPVLRTLISIRNAGIHMEITHLVIPTLNDDLDRIGEMCTWIVKELGDEVPIHFSRFYPLYKLSALPRTPVETLDQARAVALQAGMKFVYVAKVIGHDGENTFCPQCGERIIKRVGFMVEENQLVDGSCGFCGRAIPGRWV